MHPELTYMINTQRNREMQDQATAWRRVREARHGARPRPTRIQFTAFARLARSPQSAPRLTPLRRPAAS